MQSKGVEKSRIIGPISISKRGGSFQATIPSEVAKHLEIDKNSKIVYVIDSQSGYVLLDRADKMELTLSKLGKSAVLGFTVHKELAKKLLKKKLERRST